MALFDTSKLKIPFMRYRMSAYIISGMLIVGSLFLIFARGLNLSVDFTGGLVLQVAFEQSVSVGSVRESLGKAGQSQSVIQPLSDSEMLIRFGSQSEDVRKQVLSTLEASFGSVKVLKIDKVGPVVGEELRRQALIALSIAILGVLAYMAFRFQFRFGLTAVLSLVHDSIIMLGAYSLTGREVSSSFIAVILTVVGYSLNDSIVVLDRVRENWGQVRSMGIMKLIDNSINQTLPRTINTSLTTLLPVLAMFFFGGEVISNFAFGFLVGIIVGTYSSVYTASALLADWYARSPKF